MWDVSSAAVCCMCLWGCSRYDVMGLSRERSLNFGMVYELGNFGCWWSGAMRWRLCLSACFLNFLNSFLVYDFRWVRVWNLSVM